MSAAQTSLKLTFRAMIDDFAEGRITGIPWR